MSTRFEQKQYIDNECTPIAEIISKIKEGQLGEYKKVKKIQNYKNKAKKQERVIIDLEDNNGNKKQINLLAVLIINNGSKQLLINNKSYEYIREQHADDTSFTDYLDKFCDSDDSKSDSSDSNANSQVP